LEVIGLPRQQDYPDHTTHRKQSVLPPKLQTDIVELSNAIERGTDIGAHLSSCVSRMGELAPDVIVRAATDGRYSPNARWN